MGASESFLRKAIGWALRQYAWTDPREVKRYVKQNAARLSPLSKHSSPEELWRGAQHGARLSVQVQATTVRSSSATVLGAVRTAERSSAWPSTRLRPRHPRSHHFLSQVSQVGRAGFEPATSRLSGVRSNHYGPGETNRPGRDLELPTRKILRHFSRNILRHCVDVCKLVQHPAEHGAHLWVLNIRPDRFFEIELRAAGAPGDQARLPGADHARCTA